MKSRILFLVAILVSTLSFSQTKVGTIDSEYIITLMPEREIVNKQAKKYGTKLDTEFNGKVKDFRAKLQAFKAVEKTLTDSIKKTRLQELNTLDRDIQQYRKNGSMLMQLKQNELMRPLYKKLNDVIATVAKENGYTQILTLTGNEFGYVDTRFDITKLVLNKLGIKEPEKKK